MNNFDVTAIENAFVAIVKKSGVSANVYTNRPKSKPSTADFVVVRVADSVDDMSTFGNAVVAVDLFARNVANEKNGAKLSFMYGKLLSGMPTSYEVKDKSDNVVASYLIEGTPTILADAVDDFDFHARIVNFNVTIKAL